MSPSRDLAMITSKALCLRESRREICLGRGNWLAMTYGKSGGTENGSLCISLVDGVFWLGGRMGSMLATAQCTKVSVLEDKCLKTAPGGVADHSADS
jgi:hypothetical protein